MKLWPIWAVGSISGAVPALVTVISFEDRSTLTSKSVGMNCTLHWDWFRDE